MNERRYDIDWLRVIAMLAIFLYHCTRFFDIEGWHLKNMEQSFLLFMVMRALIWPWVMEIFFLVSGVASWYVLKSRTAGEYLWERVKRLLIPLYFPKLHFPNFRNNGILRPQMTNAVIPPIQPLKGMRQG